MGISRAFYLGIVLTACAESGGVGADPYAQKPDPAVYVSMLGDDTLSGSTPQEAMKTINAAIERAKGCACPVRIAAGKYKESIKLAEDTRIEGGYSLDFAARDTAAHLVTLVSEADKTMSAMNLKGEVSIDGVTIVGPELSSFTDGRSSYALWVKSSLVHVTNSTILGGVGASGAPGKEGTDMACVAKGGVGGSAVDCSGGNGTGGESDGDPKFGGGGGAGGGSNCPSACPLVNSDGISGGEPGSPGALGAGGRGGSAPVNARGAFVDGTWVAPMGEAGERGLHGTGGGGGGSGGSKRFRACFGCDTLLGGRGADGAPGGCGGGGGGAGSPGGGAFALAVVDAKVTLAKVLVKGGGGGRGGAGGAGREGQPGGDDVSAKRGERSEQKCGAIHYQSGGGGLGGKGGKGGSGGGGAGGVGGASITILMTGSASVVKGEAVGIVVGLGGAGGAGGASLENPGATGLAGVTSDEESF